jgi:hypothetical protein
MVRATHALNIVTRYKCRPWLERRCHVPAPSLVFLA